MTDYDRLQQEPDTRDSLAAMASRVSMRTVSQDCSEDPVTGAFPPVQADAATSSREARSVQSSSNISLRRTEPIVIDPSAASVPRRVSSDPRPVA